MRDTCRRCLRPAAFCVCEGLAPVDNRIRVVLLQHPREARLAICSAWLTRIALARAELHRGVCFEDDRAVRAAVEQPGAALLYPGAGATPAERWSGEPLATLVVIDGTWVQSEKMLAANPRLAALPRVAIEGAESGYGALRREPAEGCLSTLEAVAHALGALEGGADRFTPMREAFRRAVELQLACTRDARRNPRHRPSRAAAPSDPGP